MYGKFFASTFTGSMFGAGPDVFAVWAYVIANCNDSTVELNPQLLGAVIGTTPERIQKAIDYLCDLDPRSRNPEMEGRRLVKEGGFQYRVVSHAIYRAIRNEDDRREYNRLKQQESRARRKSSTESLTVIDKSPMSTMSAHTEAESDTDTETEPPAGEPKKPSYDAQIAAGCVVDKLHVKGPYIRREIAEGIEDIVSVEELSYQDAVEVMVKRWKAAETSGAKSFAYWLRDGKHVQENAKPKQLWRREDGVVIG